MHRTTTTSLVATAGLVAAGALALAAPALAGADVSRAAGELVRYSGDAPVAEVPVGARARVQSVAHPDGRLVVTLRVHGLEPFAEYGAHVHVGPCGRTGQAAGPHFQFVPDPVTPSVDPAYANPRNEVWLDLTTDRTGQGRSTAELDQQFPPGRRPRSVILHERHTAAGPRDAGTAGQRVACLTVPF